MGRESVRTSESLIPEIGLPVSSGISPLSRPWYVRMTQVEGTVSRELTDLVAMTLRVGQYFLTTSGQIISPFKGSYCCSCSWSHHLKTFSRDFFLLLNLKTSDFMRACLVLQIQYSCGVMGQSRMEADTNTLRGCVTLGKSLNLSEPVLPHLESEIAGRTI